MGKKDKRKKGIFLVASMIRGITAGITIALLLTTLLSYTGERVVQITLLLVLVAALIAYIFPGVPYLGVPFLWIASEVFGIRKAERPIDFIFEIFTVERSLYWMLIFGLISLCACTAIGIPSGDTPFAMLAFLAVLLVAALIWVVAFHAFDAMARTVSTVLTLLCALLFFLSSFSIFAPLTFKLANIGIATFLMSIISFIVFKSARKYIRRNLLEVDMLLWREYGSDRETRNNRPGSDGCHEEQHYPGEDDTECTL